MQAEGGACAHARAREPGYRPRPLVTQPRGARNPGDLATDRVSLWKPLEVAASLICQGS